MNRRQRQSRAVPWLCGAVMFAITLTLISIETSMSTGQRTLFSDAPPALKLGPSLSSKTQYSEISSTKNPGKFPPFSCQTLLEEMNNGVWDGVDPNKKFLYARQADFHPRFWVSLHNKSADATRWVIYDTGVYYERKLSRAFEEILDMAESPRISQRVLASKSPNSKAYEQVLAAQPPNQQVRVIDVGGNVGFFSLLSASKGAVTVDTFEPNVKNRMRMCESLSLNRWYGEYDDESTQNKNANASHVNVYSYGVGKEAGMLNFSENPRNPGMGSFGNNGAIPGHKSPVTELEVITLDDFARERGWFDERNRPTIAILKVDVEGLEYAVLEGAKEMLSRHLVRNVFMEVSARNKKEAALTRPCLQILLNAGYKLHKTGNWRGPHRPNTWTHDETMVDNIMDATTREQAKQLNLWWTL